MSTRIHSVLACVCLMSAACFTQTAHANTTVLSFQQGLNGYAGTADTNLRSADPDSEYGAEAEVSIDASDGGSPTQSLLRFGNLFGLGAGQIKPGDVIVKASLTLNITSAGSGIRFHDMLVNWSESATWNSMGNGIDANGIEASIAPFAAVGANDGEANIEESVMTFDVTASLKAQQLGTVPGYGWALLPFMLNGTNGVDFTTREWDVVAERPLLTVEVTPVPEPTTGVMLFAGGVLLAGIARRRKLAH